MEGLVNVMEETEEIIFYFAIIFFSVIVIKLSTEHENRQETVESLKRV